jgi:protein SCO1/2
MRDRRTPFGVLCGIALAAGLAIAPACARAAEHSRSGAPDFTLVDQHGRPFTLSRHVGHPVVLFFGYTHCPDVCPTILANLKRARDAVAGARDTVVALVTVDPRRDSATELARFVETFDRSFVGLRGTSDQLERVYHAYHVKIEMTDRDGGSYLVAHTAFVYYIARDGRLSGFGTWNDPQPILDEDLEKIARRSP